jgi:hypothetical protein
MKHRTRLLTATLGVAALLVGALVSPGPAQAALTHYCVNADNRPPWNWTDRCSVSTVDRSTTFIAELTGSEGACDPVRRTSHRQRIRVVADYQSTGKLLIRAIDIRYLSGTPPWAYYEVEVVDGNGQFFYRDWNNNGDVIYWDGASDVVDNTVHITPSPGFAPTFGARGYVDVMILPHFTRSPTWALGQNQVCIGDRVVARFMRP